MTAKAASTQLRIASPCSQDWDSMIGNHRVGFCEHCQLSVQNLDLASQKQIRRLIARSGDRLCVSYSQPVPPRVPTVPILHKIGRRTSALAAGAVTAALGLSTAIGATPNPRSAVGHTEIAPATSLKQFSTSAGGTLYGFVYDPNGAVVTGASVTLVNTETKE